MLQVVVFRHSETPLSIIRAHSATDCPPLFTAICDTLFAAKAVPDEDNKVTLNIAIANNFFKIITSEIFIFVITNKLIIVKQYGDIMEVL